MRRALCARSSTISAVIPAGKHLFPFRTEKLSLPAPMVLGGQPPGRVGRRRLFRSRTSPPSARLASFGSLRPRAAFAPVGSSARRRRTRSPTGGCVTNSAARPFLGERVDRVERLGRRARRGTGTAPPSARAGSARRRGRAASRRSRRPRRSAANSRFVESSRWRNAAAIGPRNDEQRALEPAADAARCSIIIADRTTSGVCTSHVAVVDLRELVREHALELGRRSSAEQPGARPRPPRHACRGRRRAPAGARRRAGRAAASGARRAPPAARPSSAPSAPRASGSSRRADHPERDAVGVEDERRRPTSSAAEEEERRDAGSRRAPSRCAASNSAEADEQQPRLREVPRGDHVQTASPASSVVGGSSSASPRGGQSCSARRSGWSSGARRCSGAGSGCARSARCGRRPRCSSTP